LPEVDVKKIVDDSLHELSHKYDLKNG